jgi:predicted DNA-binding protein
MRKGTRRTSYVLTERQLAALKGLSDETGLSVSEILRRAVDAYLEERTARDVVPERTILKTSREPIDGRDDQS